MTMVCQSWSVQSSIDLDIYASAESVWTQRPIFPAIPGMHWLVLSMKGNAKL